MEQDNRLGDQKNYHHNSSKELFVMLTKKTSPASQILKYLMGALYSPRTKYELCFA